MEERVFHDAPTKIVHKHSTETARWIIINIAARKSTDDEAG
jgi:hypothetical protein